MTGPQRRLIDDCFLHDSERMRHHDVLALLRDRLKTVVDTQTIPLDDAPGRTLAEDILAPRNVPLDDNAAVDGFAFAHADYLATDGHMKLAGRIAAGHPLTGALPDTTCVTIFTGAPLPQGADTVVMQEDCDRSGESDGNILIPQGLKPGANRRCAGEDLKSGDLVLSAGETLKPAGVATLASMGLANVTVRKKLRIGILSTGDEIITPGTEIGIGQVFDANRPMLRALANSPKATVVDLGHVRDNEDDLASALADSARRCDLVITSGGASRGEEDHALAALDRLGKRHLWQIAVKPGRPMMFGQIGDTVVIALPGNPVAAMVCFLLYLRPVIAHLTGTIEPSPTGMVLPADFEFANKKAGRREFLRGWRHVDEHTGTIVARKFPRDGSGLISSLRAAEGLIELAEDVTSVVRGEPVRFVPFADMDF